MAKALAPENYESLYSNWRHFAFRIFRSYGVIPADLDDCFMELVASAVEGDILAKYQPELGASWTTYFARFAKWSAMKWVNRKRNLPLTSLDGMGEVNDSPTALPSSLVVDVEYDKVLGIRLALEKVEDVLRARESRQSVYREATRTYTDMDGNQNTVKVSARSLLELYAKGYSREEILEILGVKSIWLLRAQLKEAVASALK